MSASLREKLELPALAAAVLVTLGTMFAVPSWVGSMTEICRVAAMTAIVVMAIMVACRFLGERGVLIERITAALFLAGMPLVYVIRWLEVSRADAGTLALVGELVGVVIFGGLAFVGFRRAPWALVSGIAAHGIAWDAWHTGSRFMFDWYAIGCLACDVGLASYLALRVPVWREARQEDRKLEVLA